jgi:hypothetical protein
VAGQPAAGIARYRSGVLLIKHQIGLDGHSGFHEPAWARPAAEEKSGWRERLPALLSLLFVMSLFTFFTQFANAFTHANILAGRGLTTGDSYYRDTTRLASILIPTGIEPASTAWSQSCLRNTRPRALLNLPFPSSCID